MHLKIEKTKDVFLASTTIILTDLSFSNTFFDHLKNFFQDILRDILSTFNTASYQIFHIVKYSSKITMRSEPGCKNYIIFCQDPEITGAKFGQIVDSRVFMMTVGSSWQIKEFFSSRVSQNILNLLVASVGPALQKKHQNVINYH